MNHVVHFEIQAKDPARMQEFYEAVFGWSIKRVGFEGRRYWLINTDQHNSTSAPAGINGGIVDRAGDAPVAGAAVNAYVCTISVEDIDATLQRIEKAGGTFATDKVNIPGVGIRAHRKDPEGNIFGVLEPAAR